MIKAFAGLEDTAPQQKLPIGLTGYQRAMAHQYCEELGVSSRSEGSDPKCARACPRPWRRRRPSP